MFAIYTKSELGEELVKNWPHVEGRLKTKRNGQKVVSALNKHHSIVVVEKEDCPQSEDKQIILITTRPFGTETIITQNVVYQELLEWAMSTVLQKPCKVKI